MRNARANSTAWAACHPTHDGENVRISLSLLGSNFGVSSIGALTTVVLGMTAAVALQRVSAAIVRAMAAMTANYGPRASAATSPEHPGAPTRTFRSAAEHGGRVNVTIDRWPLHKIQHTATTTHTSCWVLSGIQVRLSRWPVSSLMRV